MIATRNVHVLDLSCSNQLTISNKNTHAFRPNFTVAPFKALWRLRRAGFLSSYVPLSVFHLVFSFRLQTWGLHKADFLLSLTSTFASLSFETENTRRPGAAVDSCSKQHGDGLNHNRDLSPLVMVLEGACISAT